ncbi:MAG TPA: DUF2490 domain-containing protein [Flavobacteriales bacterium]|nr:DUF2490 domain-containing protein [Flavobacteriales bacterium]
MAILLCLGLAAQAAAQGEGPAQAQQDAQLWFSLAGEIKPFRKKEGDQAQPRFFRNLRTTGELGWKLNENGSNLSQFNIDAGARYAVTGFMRLGAQYRYSMRDRYTSDRQRVDGRLYLKYKHERLKADYRLVYEHSFREPRKLRTLLRNRIAIGYNIPKWKYDPFISVESFTALHYTGNRLVGMRYDLGTDINLNKNKTRTLEVALRHDREVNTSKPTNSWILVLALENAFKRK